jgi:hypothetical protein
MDWGIIVPQMIPQTMMETFWRTGGTLERLCGFLMFLTQNYMG